MIQEGAIDPIRITVEQYGTLIIKCAFRTNPTNIFACEDMWQGIMIQEAIFLSQDHVFDKEPEISDAETAISSTGKNKIRGTYKYKENYISIELERWKFCLSNRHADCNQSGRF